MNCVPHSDDNLCDALITLGFDIAILLITVAIVALMRYIQKQTDPNLDNHSSYYQASPKSQNSFLFRIGTQGQHDQSQPMLDGSANGGRMNEGRLTKINFRAKLKRKKISKLCPRVHNAIISKQKEFLQNGNLNGFLSTMYLKYMLYYSATVVIVVLILRSIEIIYRINNLDGTPLYLWQLQTDTLKWLLFAVLSFTSLSFYIFIWRFALKTGPILERQSVTTTKLSSKTVHISNIPRMIPFAELEEVIKQLIGMCFPRAQTTLVTVVPDYEQLTHLQAKHNSLSEKLESIRQSKSNYLVTQHSNLIGGRIDFDSTGALKKKQKNEKKFKKLQQKEAKIFSKVDQIEQLIEDQLELQSNSNTGHAFISFTTTEAAQDLISRGYSKKRMMGRQMSLSSYKYKTWIFERANEPYEINWENLGKTSHNNCLYKAYQYALLLAVSFAAMSVVFFIERTSYFVNHYFLINLSQFVEYTIKVFTPLLAYFYIWFLLPKLCIYLTKGELIKTRSIQQSSYYRKVFVFAFLSSFVFGFFILLIIQYYIRHESFSVSKTKAREELVSFGIRFMIHTLFISTWYRINRNPNQKFRLFSQTHDYDHVLTSQYSQDIHLHFIFFLSILMTANILLQKSPLFGFLIFGYSIVKVSFNILLLQYYSEKYVVLLDTESQFDIYNDFLSMNLHSTLLVQKLVVIVYLEEMSLPIWLILLILFIFIVIYCFASRFIRNAAKSKGNVVINESGKVELSRQQSEGYMFMQEEADSYLHPAFKYYKMPQQRPTISRKTSLNFNTKLSYSGAHSPKPKKIDPERRFELDQRRANQDTSLLLFSN